MSGRAWKSERSWIWILLGPILVVCSSIPVTAQKLAEAKNMDLVGYNDLQGRSAYQPVIHKQGSRWIAYVGHHGGAALNAVTGKTEYNGTSIIDVTDPRQPTYLAHIPGELGQGETGGGQMVRLCDGAVLPHADRNKVYLLRTMGKSSHEMWDVTDPARPKRLTVIVSGLTNTHKSWWECDSGIAYLVSGPPDWRVKRMMQVYDLSNPAEPIFIRNFGLPGQQPGAKGPIPTELHGAMSTGQKGNRIYAAYGASKGGVIEIIDRDKLLRGLKEPTDENLMYPVVARVNLPPEDGAHSTYPLIGMDLPEFAKIRSQSKRDFLFVTGETDDNECRGPRQMVRIFDITAETNILGVAAWTVPEASGNFCGRGGRFGTHSTNENFTSIYYKRIVFVTHFNAGVRALDIRDPFTPKEVAYYIPAATDKTTKNCADKAANENCKIAIQTNNVEVDDRGYIYIVDRANTGMHILQLTGEARAIANLP